MNRTLTPGRWRGLKTCSSADNRFNILAFDQRGSYRKMLPPPADFETAVEIKNEVVMALSQHVSAVLLDPVYGLSPAMQMSGKCGLLFALEKSGYSGDSTYRRMEFVDNWNVARIKRLGAGAVKLLVYYHPEGGQIAEEIESLVEQVIRDCREQDIPLFLEPMSYSLNPDIPKESEAFAATRPEVVRETARRLGALGPDILKLEFPVDAAFDPDQTGWQAACEAVSEASPVPWVLLSAGVDYATFEKQVRVACQGGASGFLAGRAIWKESVAMDPMERAAFITETAVERIEKLRGITGVYARAWTDFYEPPAAHENWFLEEE